MMMLVLYKFCLFILSAAALPSVIPDLMYEDKWDNCTYEEDDPIDLLCAPGRILNTNLDCSRRRRCCLCPKGTFIDKWNKCNQCKPHRNCLSEGREFISRGNGTHDAICGDYIITSTAGEDVSTAEHSSTVPNLTGGNTMLPCGTNLPDNTGKAVIHQHGFIVSFFIMLVIIVALIVSYVKLYYKLKKAEAENRSLRQLCRISKDEDEKKFDSDGKVDQGSSNETISTV